MYDVTVNCILIDLEFWKAATSFITLFDDKPTQGLTFQQFE